MIDRIGLYNTIFTDPTTNDIPEPSTDRWNVAYRCLENMRLNSSPGAIYKQLVTTAEAGNISWMLSALVPWVVLEPPSNNSLGRRSPPFATLVAREGVKQNNRVCDIVTGATRNLQEVSTLKDDIVSQNPYINERDTLGMRIRKWDQQGGNWRLHVVLAILVEAMKSDVSKGMLSFCRIDYYGRLSINADFDEVLRGWQRFVDHLKEMDLLDAPSWKRPIDGSQLARALNARPGVWMAAALDVCMAWRFRNPTATDPSPAIEEVRLRAKDLGIPI